MGQTSPVEILRRILAWLESVPPILGSDKVAPFARSMVLAAILIALLVSAVNIGLIVDLGNTNLRTTNGLWKSPFVHSWEQGSGAVIDNGEILYLPVYGFLCRLIPDRLMQFDVPAPMVTFRKISVLNAIFGGLASACLFLLALRLTGSATGAWIAVTAHACAGFIMLNSINSEDIIPAYAMFVASALFLFEYLHRGKTWMFALSATLLALSMLLHWTLMPPALAATGLVFVIAGLKDRRYFPLGLLWLAVFLCATQAMMLVTLPRLHIPIWAAVFPGKANTGWQGLFWDKFPFLLVGIGNYFTHADNVSAYQGVFERRYLVPMLVSWTWVLLGVAACTVAAFRRKLEGLKYFAIYALVLFVLGEAGAFYSQPQDPQLHIEPLFAACAGVVVLARGLMLVPALFQRVLALVFTVGLAANGVINYGYFQSEAGGEDRRNIVAVTELDRLFPRDRTLFLTQGFEGWVTWQYVLEFQGNSEDFLSLNYSLATPFSSKKDISAAEAAVQVKRQIDAALSSGKRVIAGGLWTVPGDRFVALMGTLIDTARAREFDAILRHSYRTGQHWDTKLGSFVEVLPLK